MVGEYIKKHFSDCIGLVYCHSQKNTMDCAEALNKLKIEGTYYHADCPDEDKLNIQNSWAEGNVS